VAVAISGRRLGLVCLSARLRAVHVRVRYLRDRPTRDKIAIVVREISHAVRTHDPPLLLVECPRHELVPGFSARINLVLAKALGDAAVPCVAVRAADAARRLGTPTLLRAGELLAQRYPSLARRVLDEQRRLRKSNDVWREVRPLVVAFLLAHAVGVETLARSATHPNASPYVPPQ
jgi:hypothetical protein